MTSAPRIRVSATCTASRCSKVKIDQSFLRDLGEDERRVTLLRDDTLLLCELATRVR